MVKDRKQSVNYNTSSKVCSNCKYYHEEAMLRKFRFYTLKCKCLKLKCSIKQYGSCDEWRNK